MTIKEDIKKVVKEVDNTSFAFEILQDYKKVNKRQFIVILILIFSLIISIGYTIYLLNDIGTVQTTTSQSIEDVENINGTVVNGGDINGNDKTN